MIFCATQAVLKFSLLKSRVSQQMSPIYALPAANRKKGSTGREFNTCGYGAHIEKPSTS
jgi:hypothetical protein